LFTNLVRWPAGALSFPLSDVILAQLACPESYVMFCLQSGITNLSLYKHCLDLMDFIVATYFSQILAKFGWLGL
jgi:hypothetical protein